MLMTKAGNDHFRLGLMFAHRLRAHVRHVRPVRQVADGSGLEPDRGSHRPAGRRRPGDGGLRHRGQARVVPRGAAARPTVVAYGLIPIAGAQLCYYNAVSHLSVGVALLLEYTAPILVVGWIWATTRRRPSNRTLAGVGAGRGRNHAGAQHLRRRRPRRRRRRGLGPGRRGLCGLLLHDERQGHVGRTRTSGGGLNPITLAAGGLIVGAAAVGAAGLYRNDAADVHRERRRDRRRDRPGSCR